MPDYGSSIDNQPIRYYNGKPIYLTLYLAVGLAIGTVVTLILHAGRFPTELLGLLPPAFLSGMLWQPLTYVFVNSASFFTPLGLICFYFWGVEVEKYLGRRQFLSICGALIAMPVVVSVAAHWLGFFSSTQGDYYLLAGLLIAFATLYPDMDYIGGWIPLKWFAFACTSFAVLADISNHAWVSMAIILVNCATAFLMIRATRGLLDFNFKIPWPKKKPRLRVVPRPVEPRPARGAQSSSSADAESEMDALLDKIARSGLQSLSEAEKTKLEMLRQKLLKNEP